MQSNGNDLFEKLLGPVSPMAGVGMGARNGIAPPPTASVSFADGLMGNENDSAACANSGKGRGAMGGFGAQQQQQQQQLRPARAPFGERGNSFEFATRPGSLKHGTGAGGFKPFTKLAAAPVPPPLARGDSATPMSTSADDGPLGARMMMAAATTPSTAGGIASAAASTEPLPTPTATPPQALARATKGNTQQQQHHHQQQQSSGLTALFLWEDPVLTALAFVFGGAALGAGEWALAGGAPVSPTSAAAYVLLAHLGVNFLRALVSKRWHAASMWEGAWADAAAERAVRAVRRAAAVHDALLSTRDPHVTLRVALVLWALAWLGTTFSARTLFYAAYVAAFTVPGVYAARRAAIDARLAALRRATFGAVDTSEMPRTTRLLALAAALALLAAAASWAQVAIGALVAATYWRTTLAPAEVAAIHAAAEPLTADVDRSVRRVRARLSAVLDDARAMVNSTTGPASRTASRVGAAAHHHKRRF